MSHGRLIFIMDISVPQNPIRLQNNAPHAFLKYPCHEYGKSANKMHFAFCTLMIDLHWILIDLTPLGLWINCLLVWVSTFKTLIIQYIANEHQVLGLPGTAWWCHQMETFSALLAIYAGKITGHRWIPRTKTSDAELWCFIWYTPE